MDEIAPEYDVVVLGTGLSCSITHVLWACTDICTYRLNRVRIVWVCNFESPWALWFSALNVLSVLSVKGKKVLHIDRNDHYGGSVPTFVTKMDLINIGQRGCLYQHRICGQRCALRPRNWLTLTSFSKDMAIIQKGTNRGRSTDESMTGTSTWYPSY